MRRIWVCTGLVLAVAACGGGEPTLTEYVESLNDVVGRASEQYYDLVASEQGGVLVAEGGQLTAFTPQDLQAALEQVSEIAVEVEEAVSAIEAPEQVADLHRLFFDFNGGFVSAQEALATRAGTAADWEELSETPEMAAYRVALAKDKQSCAEFQAKLDATEERGVFAETPWIPGELKEVVELLLGCEGYPEHPEDVYRPPPTSTP